MAGFDFDGTVFDATYATFGVPARVALLSTTNDGPSFDLIAIDKTEGVEVSLSQISLPSIKPVIALRGSDLIANGVTDHSALKGATVTLNPDTDAAASWRVENVQAKPTPSGPFSGEFWLMVIQAPL